jgi:hypothetical protein
MKPSERRETVCLSENNPIAASKEMVYILFARADNEKTNLEKQTRRAAEKQSF